MTRPAAPELDIHIVVPSAGAMNILRTTLPALAYALNAAGIEAARATVVDDAPTRGGISDLARELGFNLKLAGGRGRGSACNVGAEGSVSRWILFLDDDIELDPDALVSLRSTLQHGKPPWLALVGSLRPPEGAPSWLVQSYKLGTITTSSALLARTHLAPVELTTPLLVVERAVFESIGGFPSLPKWGNEDLLFGLSLAKRAGSNAFVRRSPDLSGIHHYLPGWDEWLERRERSGRLLWDLERRLSVTDATPILEAYRLRGSRDALFRKAAGRIPLPVWRLARGNTARRVAGAAVTARGYELAKRLSDEHRPSRE